MERDLSWVMTTDKRAGLALHRSFNLVSSFAFIRERVAPFPLPVALVRQEWVLARHHLCPSPWLGFSRVKYECSPLLFRWTFGPSASDTGIGPHVLPRVCLIASGLWGSCQGLKGVWGVPALG